jgi:TPR repeat protein
MASIFISHSSLDNNFACELKSWLADQGYESVFLDFDNQMGLRAGQQWEKQLYEQLLRCHALILVITKNWFDSKWCFAEFTQARALGKLIFPVIFSPVGDDRVAPEIQGIDLTDWNAEGQSSLRQSIREINDEISRGFHLKNGRSPYPGIASFDWDDAAIFFGRTEETREIIERLEGQRVRGGKRILLIIGASGSGKSSVMKAGVLPQLNRDKSRWKILPYFRPELSPVTNLAKCIAESLGQINKWQEFRNVLIGDKALAALKGISDELRVGVARSATIIFAIDQFEEIFTVSEPGERAYFLSLLNHIAEYGNSLPFVIVGTVRADVLEEILRAREFSIQFESYLLRQMPVDRFSSLIEGPATVAGLSLENGLVDRLKADAKSAEALPLLAFSLRELYDRFGQDHRLTIHEYEQLGDPTGQLTPIENSVRRKATDVLSALKDRNILDLTALRRAFISHLVAKRDDGTFVRLPECRDSLPAESLPAIDKLADAYILTKWVEKNGGKANRIMVEIAHESLFKAWPPLARWLDEEAEFLAGKAQLSRSLADFQNTVPEKRADALLHGLQLIRARQWLLSHQYDFTREEQKFIQDSYQFSRRKKLTAYALISAAVLLILTLGVAKIFSLYASYAASECDRRTAEIDNNLGLPWVEFDRIETAIAIPECRKAVNANPNHPRLIYSYARALDAGKDFKGAAEWYRKAADLNWAWAQNNLAMAYLNARGVPFNIYEATILLRKAAGQNNEQAIANYQQNHWDLVKENPDLIEIIKKQLIKKGYLQMENNRGVWGSKEVNALNRFKVTEQIQETGVSFQVLDRLNAIQELSEAISAKQK